MAGPPSRLRDAIASTVLPRGLRGLEREVRDRLRKAAIELNPYGYDPCGFSPEAAFSVYLSAAVMHRYYFRVETHGVENVPKGRVLLIGNHAGQFAWDGSMLTISMLLEADPPRICRGMGEYFLWKVPWMGITASRMGTLVGTPENCVKMLEREECVMVFPEGATGANKPFRKRYQLQRFGRGFMRLALETHAPVVPVGIVGSEEQQPGLANFETAGRAIGLPSLPITISMPWLGPLGAVFALPVKYRMYFGEPIQFEGNPHEEDSVVDEKVDVVKQAMAGLLARGLEERKGIFR